MKWLCLIIFFLFSCSVTPHLLTFDKSNEFFLERTINRLQLGPIHVGLEKKDRIIVTSMEMPEQNDIPRLSIIEDRIIEKLTQSGFQIFERDPDLIKSLVKESETHHFLYEAGKQGEPNKSPLKDTKLPPATKIVSYRVEEFGYKFRPHTENRSLKVREGFARIHFRVQRAKDGMLLCAETIDVMHQDDISEEDVDAYEDFKYTFYTHQYPIIQSDSVHTDAIEPIEPEKVGMFDTFKWYTEPQLVLRSGAGLGFGVRYGLGDEIKRFTGGLYYSTNHSNHYSFALNYDRRFNIPRLFDLNSLKLVTRFGAGFTNNQLHSGLVFFLGGGFEYTFLGMNIHMGWNHGLPFQNIPELWSSDYIFSINFLH